jgi:hypothetical protein
LSPRTPRAATAEDAANARAVQAAGLPIVSIHIRYVRARVGRWTYDGKVAEVEGEAPVFSYNDRQERPRQTTRFTPLG